jgi:hypothetical protein
VFCTAEDLLPEKGKNAGGSVRDAELVTLAVAPLPDPRRSATCPER